MAFVDESLLSKVTNRLLFFFSFHYITGECLTKDQNIPEIATSAVHLNFFFLFQLIDKFGVDKEEKGPNKTRLWAKVTKEYNNITGNAHTKARLSKKWQNIKHNRKMKRQKLFEYPSDQKVSEEAIVNDEGICMYMIALYLVE